MIHVISKKTRIERIIRNLYADEASLTDKKTELDAKIEAAIKKVEDLKAEIANQ